MLFGLFGNAKRSSHKEKAPSTTPVGTVSLPRIGKAKLQLDEVFPLSSQSIIHTYVARPDAEEEVRSNLRHGNAIILFSGPSKSGKTVLASRLSGNLPRAHIHVWQTMTSEEFWDSLRLAIQAPNTVSEELSDTNSAEILATLRTEAKVEVAGVGGSVGTELGGKIERGRAFSRVQTFCAPGRVGVIEHLKNHPHTVVIDDYHWMNRNLFPDIFPPLKQALGMGSKLILISVSKSAFPATGDLGDFNGRILNAIMPSWKNEEIRKIAVLGFSKMNVTVADEVISLLVGCAYFSPLLMQGLCNTYCYENGITEECDHTRSLPPMSRDDVGKLAARFAKPLTFSFESILTDVGEKKWPTRPRDGRLLSMTEAFILGISHKRPFEPITLDDVVKRVQDKVFDKKHLPDNLHAALAVQAKALQEKLGGEKGDRSPLYYDSKAKTITIVDPYFKLWARWVRGVELAGNLMN